MDTQGFIHCGNLFFQKFQFRFLSDLKCGLYPSIFGLINRPKSRTAKGHVFVGPYLSTFSILNTHLRQIIHCEFVPQCPKCCQVLDNYMYAIFIRPILHWDFRGIFQNHNVFIHEVSPPFFHFLFLNSKNILLNKHPVLCQHISLACQPSHLYAARANKRNGFISDGIMHTVYNLALCIFIADTGCQFNVLIFSIPSLSFNFQSTFHVFNSITKTKCGNAAQDGCVFSIGRNPILR
nr:MAG TPA: hypothetical protein [Caudoviricetes sp.]